MTIPADSSRGDNTYFIDAENAAEMARLTKQARQVTHVMGELLPGNPDITKSDTILDIGCGPGSWVLDAAQAYPIAQVVGIDVSQLMIDYARYRADTLALANARFQVMSATQPLLLPDNSFAVVNARLIAGFMPTVTWPSFIQECWRITRPGGLVYLTECEGGMSGITNSLACERLYSMGTQALKIAGYSFSPDGRNVGMTPMLRRLLLDGGFQQVQIKAHVLDYSSGTENHKDFFQVLITFWKLLQPFLIKAGVTTQEEVDVLYLDALEDMQAESFCGYWYLLTAWGQKP